MNKIFGKIFFIFSRIKKSGKIFFRWTIVNFGELNKINFQIFFRILTASKKKFAKDMNVPSKLSLYWEEDKEGY